MKNKNDEWAGTPTPTTKEGKEKACKDFANRDYKMKNKIEFKSLKNLGFWFYGDKRYTHEELEAEAVKEIKSNFPTEEMPTELRGLTQDQKNAIKDYIRWKNNLSGKDLK